ncbi:hypothetical protein PRUPE_7G038000 [Prunus persica]|uniref:Reverse transcriptase zinc-binding domain-containing protein n=1 Tax=Prunus persica TaxID=3760 RepID=M5WEZ7_PRUPE|nr:hypothetical protein PRUPE_7G038000 [Prunus persica]
MTHSFKFKLEHSRIVITCNQGINVLFIPWIRLCGHSQVTHNIENAELNPYTSNISLISIMYNVLWRDSMLLVILDGTRLVPSRRGNRRWKLDHSGLYSCHSFLNTCDTLQRHRPFMCLSPHWCTLCNMDRESADDLFIHCPYSLKVWWSLLQEVNAAWVIPKDCFQLLSYKIDALGRGKKAKVLWGCLVHAVFWNLWASVTPVFKDLAVSPIM